ncbi:alpha-D-ribose 1-methylphosphonate 5-triphosphate synthase subunit PhnG [Agrobacterium vitis]|nr:alpha-D-ribose 1-methylphosphonate 5-triphosphate synthase subunit PhnG [Agrobacterium vitis]MBE1437235.1 alpha-D-ribose 1-methylphosphonate 5-triphosphate synthase subunit PhnG [Agrobacterium vitis]
MVVVAEKTASAHKARKRVIDLLALSTLAELRRFWDALPEKPQAEFLRGPETGLVMVRGRMGGGGAAFNLGEVTATRATCRLSSGAIGHAHALGTVREKAKLSAIIDALWQQGNDRPQIEAFLRDIESRVAAEDQARACETAATKVDFFTMVRGED